MAPPSPPPPKPFLTAEWRELAMMNFEVDPRVLHELVPAGTELDEWNGRTFVSLVGFLFLDTRLFGLAIPFHRDFEEVNLRFYVRRHAPDGWRRGVVFVREIVPRRAIAWTARAVYGENYVALPMSHRIEPDVAAGPRNVSYAWRFRGRPNRLDVRADGAFVRPPAGSEPEFITEHYWGYARRRGGGTTEYRVEHPPWRVSAAAPVHLYCDAAALYGEVFASVLAASPASTFLAEGSAITVFRGTPLAN